MIPRIIHFIWIGEKEISNKHLALMEKAKKKLSDFRFIVWGNQEVEKYLSDKKYSSFLNDALVQKKFAFVSDYLRMAILYDFGGIYLDTDVEVLKSFDSLLDHKIVLGRISKSEIGTAFIACEPKNNELIHWTNYMFELYEKNKCFISNNKWMTDYFTTNYKDFSAIESGTQILKNDIIIYPIHFFESAKPFFIKSGGYCIHHCDGSWIENKENKKKNIFYRTISKITPRFIKYTINYIRHTK